VGRRRIDGDHLARAEDGDPEQVSVERGSKRCVADARTQWCPRRARPTGDVGTAGVDRPGAVSGDGEPYSGWRPDSCSAAESRLVFAERERDWTVICNGVIV
jgi:hypothetical protein